MKFIFMLIAPILMGTLIACSETNEGITGKTGFIKATHGADTVNIGFNDIVQIPDHDIYLTLDTIYSDSRCPADVICIWAGAYEAGFKLTSGGIVQKIKLGTYPGKVSDTLVNGIEIKLLDLLPYPDTRKPLNREDIKARVGLFW